MRNCIILNNNPGQFDTGTNHHFSSKMARIRSNTMLNRIVHESRRRQVFCHFTHKSSRLFSLSSMLQSGVLLNMTEIGVRSVPLHLVIGSESRCYDFDDHFVPRSEKNYQRWLRISDLFFSEGTIPAVDLIQVDKFFFVRDGHHRVSVAKALKRAFIDANIKVMLVKENALRDFRCCSESMDFRTDQIVF